MKILTLLFFSAALLAPAFAAAPAAEPVVTMDDLTRVTINGQPAGTIVDALANNPNSPVRAKLLDLLMARERKHVGDSLDREKKISADAVARENELKAQLAAALEAKRAAEERLSAFVAKIKAASADAVADENAKQRAALDAQKAELEAKLAQLKNSPP